MKSYALKNGWEDKKEHDYHGIIYKIRIKLVIIIMDKEDIDDYFA